MIVKEGFVSQIIVAMETGKKPLFVVIIETVARRKTAFIKNVNFLDTNFH